MTAAPGQVLMDVLDRMEAKSFTDQVNEPRPDGIRPAHWQVRFAAAHLSGPAAESATWLEELEHSISHVMAAGSADGLRDALVQHAALTAAWIRDLDGREQ